MCDGLSESLAELFFDEGFHFGDALLGALQERELVARTNEVVLRILNLVVGVAVQIVCIETHELHVGEESGCVGQVLDFNGFEEGRGGFEIAFGERLEDFHAEANLVVGIAVFLLCVGSGAKEVSEVGEDETRHDGVKVDDAEDVVFLVEEDVVHLGVAVADSFGQFSFAVESFAAGHALGAFLDFVGDVACGSESSHLVSLDGFFELLEAEFDVVEVLDGLTEFGGNVSEFGLEVAEGLADDAGTFGRDAALGDGVGDEDHHAPIFLIKEVVVLPVLAGHELEHFAVDVGGAGCFEFAADVGGDGDDVVHQHVHIGEDGGVDVLEHVVGSVSRSHDLIGGVDESVAERLHFHDVAFDLETLGDVL